jgi:hypothetical protein
LCVCVLHMQFIICRDSPAAQHQLRINPALTAALSFILATPTLITLYTVQMKIQRACTCSCFCSTFPAGALYLFNWPFPLCCWCHTRLHVYFSLFSLSLALLVCASAKVSESGFSREIKLPAGVGATFSFSPPDTYLRRKIANC